MPGHDLLITGAGGFVGRHLDVAAREAGLSVAHSEGDLRDADRVDRLVADAAPAAVIHLAGPWGRLGSDPALAEAEDVAMTTAVVQAVARHAPSAPLLAAGSAAQYGLALDRPMREDDELAPVSPYGVAKTALESLVLSTAASSGVRAIWARSFNHVGPGQPANAPVPDWAVQIAAAERAGGGVVRAGRLDVVRDVLDVRDVAAAYLALVRSDDAEGAVNVCSGTGVTLQEVMDTLIAEATVPIELIEAPELMRPTDPAHVVGDPARLQSLTGWQASIPLARSLRDVLAEHRRACEPAAQASTPG